jgi:hypothetical protein
MLHRWCIPIVACAVASGFQPAKPAADDARRADTYAIYSLLMTNPETSHGADDNEIYLIGDTTVSGTPKVPCVRPPAESAARFGEVLADFEARKDTPVRLESAFQIPKPYRLLNAAEVEEFYTRYATVGTSGSRAQGSVKVSDLFRLSDVYFNHDRTLALTAISTWCGSLCAIYQWKVLEKTADGRWEERPWTSCFAVA